jgi:hypothetical protein
MSNFSQSIYPFSAIVGQSAMKRALVLATIHPGLGGVLVRGTKGPWRGGNGLASGSDSAHDPKSRGTRQPPRGRD